MPGHGPPLGNPQSRCLARLVLVRKRAKSQWRVGGFSVDKRLSIACTATTWRQEYKKCELAVWTPGSKGCRPLYGNCG